MKHNLLKKALIEGKYDKLLKEIYMDDEIILKQRDRYIKAIEKFMSLYDEDNIQIYSAPGRSEIGGNHTDHQHGKVIAAAVNLDAIAVVTPTNNGVIKILSDNLDLEAISLDDLQKKEKEVGTSEALVRGICAKLRDEKYVIGGFNAFITSEVMLGAGLSSSACFEVLIGTILSGLYNEMKIDPVTIAKIGQYAENEYFEKPCGLMDQCASSVGSLISIDFENVNAPIVKKIDVDFSSFQYSLCIVDTKGDHIDLTDDYAAIPLEMKSVANYFGKDYLREVKEEDFFRELANIRKLCNDRAVLRAYHLFHENRRVDQEVLALENGDFNMFKTLLVESGKSSYEYLQNIYSNKDINNQSMSIALAMSEQILGSKGVCRVHGGGFAGTIQAFVESDYVESYKTEIEKIFGKDSCYILQIRKYGGIKIFG